MENLISVSEITLGQVAGVFALLFIIISAFIEIVPIKISPISAFLHWIGKKTSGEVITQLDKLEDRLDTFSDQVNMVEESVLKNDAENRRARILQFGDECRRHVKHSQESFNQVLEDMDAYEWYCDNHPNFKNNKTVLTSEYIKNAYHKCNVDDDFL